MSFRNVLIILPCATISLAFSCLGYTILDADNINSYNKIFVGVVTEEILNRSSEYFIMNHSPKKIIVRIEEPFVINKGKSDTIHLSVADNGYFSKNDRWLFILEANQTNYCLSLRMNATDKVHSNSTKTEVIKQNLEFLRKSRNK